MLWVSEFFSGFESVEQYLNMANLKEPELPDIPESWYPEVDVLVITHNEDRDIIFKTANACQHLDYPDHSKIKIYICDDTDRPEMKALAKEMGLGYLGFSGSQHAKAGNMNHAISQTSSPLIATFDADMIPLSSFLMDMVPFFFLPKMKKNDDGIWVEREESEIDPDEKIGFIQAPQSFYNTDLFQYNLYSENRIPNEQDYFFREINIGRNRSNSALFVGSNAVFSRQALADAGGVAINTITEDFETGIRIQSAGYITYALSKTLAHGMAPHTISGLIKQRDRWARGCIQSLRNVRPFFKKKLSLAAKISYFSCVVYWWTFMRRFIYIIVPIVAVIFNVRIVDCTLLQLLIFWLPYYLLINQSLKVLSGNIRSQHWNNLFDTILFPYLVMPVILETLGFTKKKFVVTSKKRKEPGSASPVHYALPHAFLLAASLIALVMCLIQLIETSTLYNIIIIFWLIHNIKNLFFSICFMLGRDNARKADRFDASEQVEIEYQGQIYKGTTTNISETGLAVTLDFPIYLPDDEKIKIRVKGLPHDSLPSNRSNPENNQDAPGENNLAGHNKYLAELICVVKHVDAIENNKKWSYSFHIAEMDEKSRKKYCQIVFDRENTLPRSINRKYTLYDDVKNNVEHRIIDTYERASRLLPRIQVGLNQKLENGVEVTVDNFNYKYAWVKMDTMSAPEHLNLTVAPGVVLELKLNEEYSGRLDSGYLYRIINLDKLMGQDVFHPTIANWVKSFILSRQDADKAV